MSNESTSRAGPSRQPFTHPHFSQPPTRNTRRCEVVCSHSGTLLLKRCVQPPAATRSEEHTSELQSLMRISYAVFCLKKKNSTTKNKHNTITTFSVQNTTSTD